MEKVHLAGCVILKDGAILLLHRIKTDWFELPGGKIDGDEKPEDAARRELKEELLCDVTILKKLGKKDFTWNGQIMSYTWFLAEIDDNQFPSIGEADTFKEYKYIDLSSLGNYNLSTNMQNFIAELKSGNIDLT